MAFIVETGAIVAGANAYITVQEYKDYWANRNEIIVNPDADIQAAIVIATQYVDLNNTWRGLIVSDTQTLDWPRGSVYDDEGRSYEATEIPQRLKYAIAEYAKRQITAELQPDVDPNVGGVIREKVDVLERQFQEGTTGYFGMKRYPLADKWLKGLTVGGVGGSFGQLRRC